MDLFERKKLWCPVCGEKLFLKVRMGGLSKREAIYYFKCDGCGLKTGKRLTIDEAVAAALPGEKALAVQNVAAPAESPFPPRLKDEAQELVEGAERLRNIEHRIVMVREKREDEPGFELIVKKKTKESASGEEPPEITRGWEAVYYSQDTRRLSWEDSTLRGLLDQVEADVSGWEAEA